MTVTRASAKKTDDDEMFFDFDGFLEGLKDVDEKSSDEVLVEGAVQFTQSYAHHRLNIIRSFLQTLAQKGKSFELCTLGFSVTSSDI